MSRLAVPPKRPPPTSGPPRTLRTKKLTVHDVTTNGSKQPNCEVPNMIEGTVPIIADDIKIETDEIEKNDELYSSLEDTISNNSINISDEDHSKIVILKEDISIASERKSDEGRIGSDSHKILAAPSSSQSVLPVDNYQEPSVVDNYKELFMVDNYQEPSVVDNYQESSNTLSSEQKDTTDQLNEDKKIKNKQPKPPVTGKTARILQGRKYRGNVIEKKEQNKKLKGSVDTTKSSREVSDKDLLKIVILKEDISIASESKSDENYMPSSDLKIYEDKEGVHKLVPDDDCSISESCHVSSDAQAKSGNKYKIFVSAEVDSDTQDSHDNDYISHEFNSDAQAKLENVDTDTIIFISAKVGEDTQDLHDNDNISHESNAQAKSGNNDMDTITFISAKADEDTQDLHDYDNISHESKRECKHYEVGETSTDSL
jgi:hypothetical protein